MRKARVIVSGVTVLPEGSYAKPLKHTAWCPVLTFVRVLNRQNGIWDILVVACLIDRTVSGIY